MQRDCVQGWSESFDRLEGYWSVRKTDSEVVNAGVEGCPRPFADCAPRILRGRGSTPRLGGRPIFSVKHPDGFTVSFGTLERKDLLFRQHNSRLAA
jgi:hypothetical protein